MLTVCPKCGKNIAEGSNFCTECGNKIQSEFESLNVNDVEVQNNSESTTNNQFKEVPSNNNSVVSLNLEAINRNVLLDTLNTDFTILKIYLALVCIPFLNSTVGLLAMVYYFICFGHISQAITCVQTGSASNKEMQNFLYDAKSKWSRYWLAGIFPIVNLLVLKGNVKNLIITKTYFEGLNNNKELSLVELEKEWTEKYSGIRLACNLLAALQAAMICLIFLIFVVIIIAAIYSS